MTSKKTITDLVKTARQVAGCYEGNQEVADDLREIARRLEMLADENRRLINEIDLDRANRANEILRKMR